MRVVLVEYARLMATFIQTPQIRHCILWARIGIFRAPNGFLAQLVRAPR